jgi:hypothetical protein
MSSESNRVIRLTSRIDRWLLSAGIRSARQRSSMAVDLADLLAAAAESRKGLNRLLKTNPSTADGAERALVIAAEMEAWMFTELKEHLRSLEQSWTKLLPFVEKKSRVPRRSLRRKI